MKVNYTSMLVLGFLVASAASLAYAADQAAVSPAGVEPSPSVMPQHLPHGHSDSASADTPKSDIKLKKGAKLYVDNCSICHGDRGDGNTRARGGMRPPPRDFTTIESALELSRERMIASVTNGRPGTGMMAHKDRMTTQEIETVVDFVRSNFMRTPDAEDVVVKNIEGRKIYNKNCSVCHGDKGNTAIWARSGLNPPPRDFTAPQSRQELTRERMIHSVTNGRPGTGMMPFKTKLQSNQIEAVVDYIREAFIRPGQPVAGSSVAAMDPAQLRILPQDANHARMRTGDAGPARSLVSPQRAPATDPHANMRPRTATADPHAGMPMAPAAGVMTMPAVMDADMSLPMPGGLKGDKEAGRRFFMSNCFTCHGVTGEGNGPRAHFNIPRPRNFTSEETRRSFNRVRLFDSITNGKVGTVMPAWSKVLTPQQIADVAEFVFIEFIYSGKDAGEATPSSDKDAGEKLTKDKKKAS